jgi:Tol biopolymer transport system component
MFNMGKVLTTAGSLLLGTALLFGGCGRQPAVGPDRGGEEHKTPASQVLPAQTVDIAGVKVTTGGGTSKGGFTNLASFSIPGGMFGYTQCPSTSPDGRWIAFDAVKDGRTESLWVMALDGSSGRILCQVGEKEHTNGTLIVELLGWTSDNRVVFTRQGTQPDGKHEGQRGISLRVATPEPGETEEVGWLPVPRGMVNQAQFLPEKESVFVHVSGALWRMDIARRQSLLIKDNLPTYDGLFFPRLSPGGDRYAYELHEPEKAGIYVLDVDNRCEEPLAPNGATWNFFPQHSPDGRHLAYYAAPLKAGRPGQNAGDYDLIPMEDGPALVAAKVVVVTSDGSEVMELEVPGLKIGDICWAADGKHLAFVAGKVKDKDNASRSMEFPEIEWKSVWLADLQGEVRKVADLPADVGGNIRIVKVGPDGTQVQFQVFKENVSLWLAREGKVPVEVEPQARWDSTTEPVPVYGTDVFLSCRVAGGDYEIFRIHGTSAAQTTSDGGMKSNVRVEGKRLIYLREVEPGNRYHLVVLSSEEE